MRRLSELLDEQCASNSSALPYFDSFHGHRKALTRLLLDAALPRVAPGGNQRLCVLGAGNAYDLELEQLLTRFAEVHLVDIDEAAVLRARARVADGPRARVFVHAPLELSGLLHDLERWARLEVTPRELLAAPATAARRIEAALPGRFDVVASTCLLTQLQLALLELLGEQHRLFVGVRELVTLTHLRTLAALTRPGGAALLVTDLCEAAVFPAGRPRDAADLAPLMQELVALGHVIHSAHPELLRATLAEDPLLERAFGAAEQSEPWLWHNGPQHRFLVYGLTLPRSARAA